MLVVVGVAKYTSVDVIFLMPQRLSQEHLVPLHSPRMGLSTCTHPITGLPGLDTDMYTPYVQGY